MVLFVFLVLVFSFPNIQSYNTFDLSTIFQIVPAWAQNTNFFNNCVNFDKILATGYNLNTTGVYTWGCEPGVPLVTAKFNIKAQNTFGEADFILELPLDRPIFLTEGVIDTHFHDLELSHIIWINEGWIEADINTILDLPFQYHHTFKVGLFPFFVGRGIALGYYLPDSQNRFFLLIPFFSIVNQYPTGMLVHGQLSPKLFYDIYGSITQNRGDTLANTSRLTREKEYGHRFCPQRGFGLIEYNLAGRLSWDPIALQTETAHLESYMVFKSKPSLNDQFSSEKFGLNLPVRGENSMVRLATIGGAGEFVTGRWEFGFDAAHNIGKHVVNGFDNNNIVLDTDQGFIQDLNDSVFLSGTINKAPVTIDNQYIITRSIEQQDQNGKPISSTLTNGPYRFFDSYKVLLRGSMFIADAAYTLIPEKLKVATTIAYSSGGEDPNVSVTTIQRNDPIRLNNNFIGLEELYVGKRVVNTFFLNGASSAPRIVDIPSPLSATPFPVPQFGFINMIFWGAAAHYTPRVNNQTWHINSNLLLYWSQHQSINYAVTPARAIPRYYGCEFNTLAEMPMTKKTKWLACFMLFFPGTYYKALEGQPITLDQFNFFNDLATNTPTNFTAVLGSDPSFVMNIGIEVHF